MEDFKQTCNLDSGLIDEIVCKVKSEGLFDQFRRESLADVDTKPAYQNLQHRVESSVSSFLNEQKWDSHTNKNQLREKLRKLIAEQNFFEAGIGRIVDQVVNPKLNTNFVPKIEDVAYKLLGVEKPSMNMKLKLEIETDALLPIYELEQVSPESEKSQSTPVTYHPILEQCDGRNEDLESPAFEPIEPATFESNDDMDISEDDNDATINNEDNVDNCQNNEVVRLNIDEMKSNQSSISGLTSNDSNNSSDSLNESSENNITNVSKENNNSRSRIIALSDDNHLAPEITIDSAEKLPFSENIISNTSDLIIDNTNQDSVLSQVSSTSRLSIVTYNTRDGETDISVPETCHRSFQNIYPFGMSEEAQMQKFNENSSSSNSFVENTDKLSTDTLNSDKKDLIVSFEGRFFDENRDKINSNKLDFNESADSKSDFAIENVPSEVRTKQDDLFPTSSHRKKNSKRELSSKNARCTHKGTLTRQRSRSKDSNDGYGSSSNNENNIYDQSTFNNNNQNHSSEESEHVTNVNELTCSNITEARTQVTFPNSQPVVIDQILTGKELDLNSFIGEIRDDPILSSIKQTLETQSTANKPKVAANMIEAKRLMKIRKRIERVNQKSLEKATVLAKQYIRTNASNMLEDTQGIELEFVCLENSSNITGPIISSPIDKKTVSPDITELPTTKSNLSRKNNDNGNDGVDYDDDDDDDDDVDEHFVGFEASEIEFANISVNHLVNVCSTFKTSKPIDAKMTEGRLLSVEENDSIGNILPTKKSRDFDVSHIDGQLARRKKARYSNEDLFKPRPLLGGRRRRGFECNES